VEIEPGGCGAYRGIRGLDVSMNRRNERRVTIVDRSGGRVDQTVTEAEDGKGGRRWSSLSVLYRLVVNPETSHWILAPASYLVPNKM
jgi:hypothetical protein